MQIVPTWAGWFRWLERSASRKTGGRSFSRTVWTMDPKRLARAFVYRCSRQEKVSPRLLSGIRRESCVARAARVDSQGRRPGQQRRPSRTPKRLRRGRVRSLGGGPGIQRCQARRRGRVGFPCAGRNAVRKGRAAYEKGVREAETTAFRVARAVSVYHKKLGDYLDRPESRSRGSEFKTTPAPSSGPTSKAPASFARGSRRPAVLGLNNEWHKTPWGKALWRAARDAYERACPHDTPRQIRAYALGLRELFAAPAAGTEKEAEKEAEA